MVVQCFFFYRSLIFFFFFELGTFLKFLFILLSSQGSIFQKGGLFLDCILIFGVTLSVERHIIAALYFNLNLLREVKKNSDGTEQVRVVWPKFKNGEATVRDVKVEPNFGKTSK